MIVRWKRVDASLYVASWQGMALELRHTREGWRHWVDGRRVKGSWPTALRAMDAAEDAMNRVLRGLMEERRAAQCPLALEAAHA